VSRPSFAISCRSSTIEKVGLYARVIKIINAHHYQGLSGLSGQRTLALPRRLPEVVRCEISVDDTVALEAPNVMEAHNTARSSSAIFGPELRLRSAGALISGEILHFGSLTTEQTAAMSYFDRFHESYKSKFLSCTFPGSLAKTGPHPLPPVQYPRRLAPTPSLG
jgi:hypothetical protein